MSRFIALAALAAGFTLSTAAAGPEELRAEIARLAVASKGVVGVAAMNLATGATVEINADRRFKLASTFKVPVAAYALHLGEQGRVRLDEPLPVPREDMLEPGILFDHFRHPGATISTLNAIELSIAVSDNGATEVIYQRVGGPAAANAWLASRGHGEINLGTRTLKETFSPGAAPSAEAEALERTTTPRAMTRFLADLQRGTLLSERHTALLLDVMSRTAGERLSLFLPPGTKVQHKTGTLFGAQGISVNDVGIVTLPNGAPVVVAVYIGDSPESVSHATRDRTIGHITRAIYDYFQLAAQTASPARAVEAFVAAFNARDIDGMLALAHADIEWLTADGAKTSVETAGKDALRKSMTAYFASCPSCVSAVEIGAVTPARVSAVETASWKTATGVRSQRSMSVYEFVDGLIRRVTYFPAEK